MRAGLPQLREVHGVLARMREHAEALRTFETPSLLMNVPDARPAAVVRQRAANDAWAAVELLDGAGASADAQRLATRAAQMLEHVAPDTIALRDAGIGLRGILDDIHHVDDIARSSDAVTIDDLAASPIDETTSEQWALVRQLLDDDPDQLLDLMPRELPGAPALSDVADSLATGDDDLMALIQAQRYVGTWTLARTDAVTVAQRVETLTEVADAGALTIHDRRWLAALADTDHHEARFVGPVARLLRDPGGGHRLDDAFANWKLDRLDTLGRTALLERRLTQMLNGQGTTQHWEQVDALLTRGTPLAGMPYQLSNIVPFDDLVKRVLQGTAPPDGSGMMRYLTAWQHARVDRTERVAELTALLSRPDSMLDNADLRRIAELFDTDATLVPRPRLAGWAVDFGSILSRARQGIDRGPSGDLQLYLHAWKLDMQPTSHRVAYLERLYARGAADLSQHEWDLANHVLQSGIPLGAMPNSLPGLIPFRDVVKGLGQRNRELLGAADEYFAAHAAAQLDGTLPPHLASAFDAAAAGLVDDTVRRTIRDQWDRIAWLAHDRSPRDQLAIAAVALSEPTISATRRSHSTLELVQTALADIGDETGLAELRRTTSTLVDRNLARLRVQGRNEGYGDHPDYAEIGRIRENLKLIDQTLSRRSAAPVVTPSTDTFTW